MIRRRSVWLVAAIALIALFLWTTKRSGNGELHPDSTPAPVNVTAPAADAPAPPAAPATTARYPAFLPIEAHGVLDRIARGGPYEYRQDGGVFQNREKRLPPRPRGYYREFTVETPGSDDRGARRIVTGGDPPSEYWYTDDHYNHFRRFDVPATETPSR